MTPAEATELLKYLRMQTALVRPGASSDEIVTQAAKIVSGLTADERDEAAAFYIVHLLKEQHRTKVLSRERAALKSQRRPLKDTLPPDDPYWQAAADREAALFARLRTIVDDHDAQLKVEWSRELLEATFALPDGRLVAWGTATVEEHEARRDMLVGNAQGNMEAASRHAQAIRDIQTAAVSRLDELEQCRDLAVMP